MKPTDKSPAMEALLEETSGRTTAIIGEVCVSAPFGCGQNIGEFKDDLSLTEYRISGLCQKCQDEIFGV